MKREDFKKIIKLRSEWKIDRRKGNYKLPSGARLYDYVYKLVVSQLQLDNLGINKDGNLYFMTDKYIIMKPFSDNEQTNISEQYDRIDKLIKEIIG